MQLLSLSFFNLSINSDKQWSVTPPTLKRDRPFSKLNPKVQLISFFRSKEGRTMAARKATTNFTTQITFRHIQKDPNISCAQLSAWKRAAMANDPGNYVNFSSNISTGWTVRISEFHRFSNCVVIWIILKVLKVGPHSDPSVGIRWIRDQVNSGPSELGTKWWIRDQIISGPDEFGTKHLVNSGPNFF